MLGYTKEEWDDLKAAFGTGRKVEAVYPGTLVGYRYWRVNSFDTELRAVAWNVPWDAPTVTASCYGLSGDEDLSHVAPSWECCCGFYGWYTPKDALGEHAKSWGFAEDPKRRWSSLVFGVIAVSGRIIPGTIGFRAERAQILGVVGQGGAWRELASDFEARYPGVAVAESIEDLIRRFPPQDVPWSKEG